MLHDSTLKSGQDFKTKLSTAQRVQRMLLPKLKMNLAMSQGLASDRATMLTSYFLPRYYLRWT